MRCMKGRAQVHIPSNASTTWWFLVIILKNRHKIMQAPLGGYTVPTTYLPITVLLHSHKLPVDQVTFSPWYMPHEGPVRPCLLHKLLVDQGKVSCPRHMQLVGRGFPFQHRTWVPHRMRPAVPDFVCQRRTSVLHHKQREGQGSYGRHWPSSAS
jgi:hypothetical protein